MRDPSQKATIVDRADRAAVPTPDLVGRDFTAVRPGIKLVGALRPQSPEALDGLARTLHSRALADGHPDIAHKLTYVFGNARCAECDAVFSVEEAMTARWG